MAKGHTSRLDYLTHHEAGHAAVAFSFGLRLERVWIDQPSDRGWTKLTKAASLQRTDMQHVLIALAGGRAGRLLVPSCVGQRTASDEDEIYALKTIHKRFYDRLIACPQPCFDGLCKRVNKRLARRCALIVEERWSAIQRLAVVLASCVTSARLVELTGEEAERVLTGENG